MKEILNRLKSPVVIVQLVTILATAVVLIAPNTSDAVEKITACITIIVNTFAGLNNPTKTEEF